jgi:hypothetical protein
MGQYFHEHPLAFFIALSDECAKWGVSFAYETVIEDSQSAQQ